MARKQLILNMFAGLGGFHMGAWRMADRDGDLRQTYDIFTWIAKEAERGKMHAFFLADRLWVTPALGDAPAASMHQPLDPISLLSALSQQTRHLGLIGTRNTTYGEPYHLAREFATLDEISGGRAAWNVVTGGGEEPPNFGQTDPPAHAERYARANEFVDAVRSLWDSWDDDAFTFDKESGVYWDKNKVHELNFEGKYIKVRGPISVLRPPQGHPLLVQAGTSPDGMALGGRVGDMIFDLSTTLDKNHATRAKFRDIAASNGRNPDHCKYIPDLHILLGRSEAEAKDKLAALEEKVDPVAALPQLSQIIGIDLKAMRLDDHLPDDIPETAGYRSWQKRYIEMARKDNLTIGQLARKAVQFPSQVIAGTAATVADRMEEYLENDAADGFMCRPATLRTVSDIVDLLIPELQRREIFRREYVDGTLRDNLALPRPESRYAGGAQ
ncbi:NtaA/DmoA family FMN-dependent monooxygenase [Nocardia pseudovaccinii]|uniref:NtaA/DmoA family FMN-dependent monooxygenase n=1 Tax=Nocardia pseudovaccinii TaxID=189540 RepID=UPI003D8B90B3